MKIKNKGKVYPSPSSSSSSSTTLPSLAVNGEKEKDFLSVLSLLPAAILALASILSLQDREVLAYMITRSLKTTTTSTITTTTTAKSPSCIFQETKKKSSRKPSNYRNNGTNSVNANHKAPISDCDCFDCYTSYWFRWDSSPNRELIHQVIEAFEDHLSNGEQSRKTTRGKRRDRTGKKPVLDVLVQPEIIPVLETAIAKSKSTNHGSPDDDVSPAATPEIVRDGVEDKTEVEGVELSEEAMPEAETSALVEVALSNHKSLARKVLPDVLGLLNSRLWSLWSPNV